MKNLLNLNLWDFHPPWGTEVNEHVTIRPELVKVTPEGYFSFGVDYKPDAAKYGIGLVISKEEHRVHFGTYEFKIRLPNFRGSWPAIWLIDLHKSPPDGDGMGLPPEIDIFEHFRKDGFLTRFHTTHTFHEGPTYADNHEDIKARYRLWPVDMCDLYLTFIWTPDQMTWKVNGKAIMTLPNTTPKFPLKPMNLIMNSGIGPDWKPKIERFSPFIIKQASYSTI